MNRLHGIFKSRTFSWKLKTQLIASYALITCIIMGTGFFLLYRITDDLFHKQNEKSTLQMFRKDENNLNTIMNEVDKLTKLIISNDDYRGLVNDDFSSVYYFTDAKVKVFELFSNILKSYDYVDSIMSYWEDGMILKASMFYNDYLDDVQLENEFYQSDLYKEANQYKYAIVWSGAYVNQFFDITGNREVKDKHNLISVVRKVKKSNSYADGATLVININETRFSSVYSDQGSDSASVMWIIDNTGTIISHPDKSRIGQKYTLAGNINQNTDSGSFTAKINASTCQVVYYKLKSNGWILLNEIPINEFNQYTVFIRNTVGIVFLICILVTSLLSVFWIYRLTLPLNSLVYAMKKMENGDIGVMLEDLPGNELGIMGGQFNKMSNSIANLMERNIRIEEEKRRFEMEALQMQINPHFLFNTLNLIKWMAIVASHAGIEESITTLGNIISPIFKNTSPQWTIREEVSFLNNYMKIINLRYSDGIHMSIDIPQEILKYNILKFILQPIIENSFIHGLDNRKLTMDIDVRALEKDGDIELSITDNGVGISGHKLEEIKEALTKETVEDVNKKGLGITNINKRIKLNYGQKYGLVINSKVGVETKITVTIPVIL